MKTLLKYISIVLLAVFTLCGCVDGNRKAVVPDETSSVSSTTESVSQTNDEAVVSQVQYYSVDEARELFNEIIDGGIAVNDATVCFGNMVKKENGSFLFLDNKKIWGLLDTSLLLIQSDKLYETLDDCFGGTLRSEHRDILDSNYIFVGKEVYVRIPDGYVIEPGYSNTYSVSSDLLNIDSMDVTNISVSCPAEVNGHSCLFKGTISLFSDKWRWSEFEFID